jgi:NDP-sugar pyrophosphorylase family protein
MDVRAIVLFGPPADAPGVLGGAPIALLDVLGRPLLQRVLERIRAAGIMEIRLAGDPGAQSARLLQRALGRNGEWEPAPGALLWRAAQRAFTDLAQAGADVVLVMRLGPLAELDFGHLLQFHLEQSRHVTAVTDTGGELLDTFLINASRRNDATFLLRHQLREFRTPVARYAFGGYVNPLAGAADVRRLAVDAFCGRVRIEPAGRQIRAGVWAAESARIHRRARLLAPSFIGEYAKVRASAVITRCSVLEHHTEVDCGTVVEDTTILPYSVVGAGLDLAHSVVGFQRVSHLRRMVEVEISDSRLVGTVATAPLRMLSRAAALAGFLPATFLRGLLGRAEPEVPLQEAAQAPSAALKAGDSLSATDPALSNFR